MRHRCLLIGPVGDPLTPIDLRTRAAVDV